VAGLIGGLVTTLVLVQNLGAKLDDAVISRGWTIGLVLSLFLAAATFGLGWMLAGKVAARIAEVGRSVGKIGRGGAEDGRQPGGAFENRGAVHLEVLRTNTHALASGPRVRARGRAADRSTTGV
jgi:hypothetical protein